MHGLAAIRLPQLSLLQSQPVTIGNFIVSMLKRDASHQVRHITSTLALLMQFYRSYYYITACRGRNGEEQSAPDANPGA